MSDTPRVNAHELLDQKYLTLTAVGPDGLPSQTPVFFVPEGDTIATLVPAQQAARLTGTVTVAGCSARGRHLGSDHFAEVVPLTAQQTAAVRERLVTRYGIVARNLTSHRDDLVGLQIRITPTATRGSTLRLAA